MKYVDRWVVVVALAGDASPSSFLNGGSSYCSNGSTLKRLVQPQTALSTLLPITGPSARSGDMLALVPTFAYSLPLLNLRYSTFSFGVTNKPQSCETLLISKPVSVFVPYLVHVVSGDEHAVFKRPLQIGGRIMFTPPAKRATDLDGFMHAPMKKSAPVASLCSDPI